MKNQPIFATRKKPGMYRSMHQAGNGFAWIAAGSLAFVAFLFCVVWAFDWVFDQMATARPGTVVCCVSAAMAMISVHFVIRRWLERQSVKFWVFAAVFFVVTALQAFLTRGVGA